MRNYKYGLTEEQKNDLDLILSDIKGAIKVRKSHEATRMIVKAKDILLNLHRLK